MADPYTQAAMIAAPYAQLGQQMFQGANMREAGYQKQMLQNAQRGAFEGHANQYNAAADKLREEASGLAQRRQYQTPGFASKIAATLNGLSPEIGDAIASGRIPEGITPEQVQNFNRGRGAHLVQLGATGDTNGEQMVKAFANLLTQGRVDRAIANPKQAGVIGQGVAAGNGDAILNNLGGNGVFNQFTGGQELNAVGKSSANAHNASAAHQYSSAGAANAQRDLTKSKIGQAQTVTMPDGTVVSTGAPIPKLTEIQAKSQLFGSRAAESDRLIRELEGKYSPAAVNAKLGAESVWGIGGALGMAGNSMLSKEGQMAEQAQRDFINAVLRQESGAAIADSEFNNARKQYFPQPGDGKEVLAQKSQNRKTAIEGLKVMAGPASGLVNYGGRPSKQDNSAAMAEAKAAIDAGAPRDLVIQRLKKMGVDGGGL